MKLSEIVEAPDVEDEDQFFVVFIDPDGHEPPCVGTISKKEGKWQEHVIHGENPPYGFGSKTYMSYLPPRDVMYWIEKDYRNLEVIYAATQDEAIRIADQNS